MYQFTNHLRWCQMWHIQPSSLSSTGYIDHQHNDQQKTDSGVLREVMSELKPKEVGIGTIGDIQGERIASGWDQMSLHSVTLLTENLIVLPVQWRLCLLSFLLPVCVLSWTCIPFLESRLSFGMILIRVFYQNSMPSITIPGDRIQLPAYLITTLIYVNSWKMLRGTNPYRKPL